jgi:endogenous inhibitor of DNA gyrase (YacG/DUF329 family)
MPDKYTAQNSILINCSLCGKEFSRSLSEYRRGSDSRFCCIVCRNRSLALDKLNKRIPCPICGKPFYAGSRNQKKTCSIGCKLEKGRLGKTRNCAYCGDEFITKNPGSKAKFCSIKCVGLSHIRVTPHKCEHCGIEFLPDTTTRIRRFCSSECRKSYMKGSNHPLWRGNRKHERGVREHELAFGAIIGTVEIVHCLPTALVRRADWQLCWGDYTLGRWAFELLSPIRFETPIPYIGRQGFFNVPDDLVARER